MTSTPTGERVIRTVSVIDCPTESVWQRVTSQEGINDEMGPYLKMTMPRSFRGKSLGDVTSGTRIGKSFLLLFGVVPCGFDDITIATLDPGRRFREESRMTGMRVWIHQRTLEPRSGPTGEQTVVTDEVTMAPQAPLSLIPGWTKLASRILTAFFAHRHRRLQKTMGAVGVS